MRTNILRKKNKIDKIDFIPELKMSQRRIISFINKQPLKKSIINLYKQNKWKVYDVLPLTTHDKMIITNVTDEKTYYTLKNAGAYFVQIYDNSDRDKYIHYFCYGTGMGIVSAFLHPVVGLITNMSMLILILLLDNSLPYDMILHKNASAKNYIEVLIEANKYFDEREKKK